MIRLFLRARKLYFKNTALKKAEAVLEKAIELSPFMAEAHITMAQIQYEIGVYEKAKYHAQQAFLIDPKSNGLQEVFETLNIDLTEDILII